jgi:hypothetical protein
MSLAVDRGHEGGLGSHDETTKARRRGKAIELMLHPHLPKLKPKSRCKNELKLNKILKSFPESNFVFETIRPKSTKKHVFGHQNFCAEMIA